MISHQELKGKKFIMNAWATWCVACKREHDLLKDIASSGVIVVGLNYKDKPEKVANWLDSLGNPFSVNLLD